MRAPVLRLLSCAWVLICVSGLGVIFSAGAAPVLAQDQVRPEFGVMAPMRGRRLPRR